MCILNEELESSPLRKIALRLGPFHTEMSFLRAIGASIDDSGLREILELIYADTAASHMLTGKGVSRAVRGYWLMLLIMPCFCQSVWNGIA